MLSDIQDVSVMLITGCNSGASWCMKWLELSTRNLEILGSNQMLMSNFGQVHLLYVALA